MPPADRAAGSDPEREVHGVVVIGGGIIGLATALELSRAGMEPLVLEGERDLATHQTGRNSGVIHSGIYYKPGSAKARLCLRGAELLERFCDEHGVRRERCGKLIVATGAEQVPALEELERRAAASGVEDVRRVGAGAIREIEPAAAGVAGLFVGRTGITSFGAVARAMAAEVARSGGSVRAGARVLGVRKEAWGFVLMTSRGEVRSRNLVNCAGLWADRIAGMCGVRTGVGIVPFRGEYYELAPAARGLVRNLIYPVPDARFPFLGVHFTRRIDGSVEAGPNAVLALARAGYGWGCISARDCMEMARFAGFWRMAERYWRTGMGEVWRSVSKRAFSAALSRLVPRIRAEDLHPSRAGVRAQAVGQDGRLLDDFVIERGDGMVHVINAPSPAATASLAIGEEVARLASGVFRRRAMAGAGAAVAVDEGEAVLSVDSGGTKAN
jgi:L-2-hydroxyglutarate oxidase